jgi:hypothetical protein
MSKTKEAYYERMEAELKKWNEEIGKLKDDTKKVDSAIEIHYYEQIEDMIALHELAQQKLQELRESENVERFQDGNGRSYEQPGRILRGLKVPFQVGDI